MECQHRCKDAAPARTRAALDFAITTGLRKNFTTVRGFVRALRGYVSAFTLTHPNERGRIPTSRCVDIARTLTQAPSRKAAELQAEMLRAQTRS